MAPKQGKKRPKAKKEPRGRKKSEGLDIVSFLSTGASELVRVRGGYELRIYSSYDDAVLLGLDSQIARAAFAKNGDCTGSCAKQGNPKSGFWCTDMGCSTGSRCRCHLVGFYKDKNGDIQEEDEGEQGDKDNPFKPKGGRTYVCRCQ